MFVTGAPGFPTASRTVSRSTTPVSVREATIGSSVSSEPLSRARKLPRWMVTIGRRRRYRRTVHSHEGVHAGPEGRVAPGRIGCVVAPQYETDGEGDGVEGSRNRKVHEVHGCHHLTLKGQA